MIVKNFFFQIIYSCIYLWHLFDWLNNFYPVIPMVLHFLILSLGFIEVVIKADIYVDESRLSRMWRKSSNR